MKNRDRVSRGFRRVGEPSSKYGYDQDAFTRDMIKHEENNERLYEDFISWLKSKDIDPVSFRFLFSRYYEDFIK